MRIKEEKKGNTVPDVLYIKMRGLEIHNDAQMQAKHKNKNKKRFK